MNTTLKEVLDMLLAERETTVELRKKVNKYAISRGTLRLLAARMGWKAVKGGPTPSAYLMERLSLLQREASSLSAVTCSVATHDPLAAMVAARTRIETLESLVDGYRRKFPSE